MNFDPKPERRFTFGLSTVGNVGRHPFGEAVRAQLSVAAVRRAPETPADIDQPEDTPHCDTHSLSPTACNEPLPRY